MLRRSSREVYVPSSGDLLNIDVCLHETCVQAPRCVRPTFTTHVSKSTTCTSRVLDTHDQGSRRARPRFTTRTSKVHDAHVQIQDTHVQSSRYACPRSTTHTSKVHDVRVQVHDAHVQGPRRSRPGSRRVHRQVSICVSEVTTRTSKLHHMHIYRLDMCVQHLDIRVERLDIDVQLLDIRYDEIGRDDRGRTLRTSASPTATMWSSAGTSARQSRATRAGDRPLVRA